MVVLYLVRSGDGARGRRVFLFDVCFYSGCLLESVGASLRGRTEDFVLRRPMWEETCIFGKE